MADDDAAAHRAGAAVGDLRRSARCKIDELMRRLDLYGLALQSVAAQDAATRRALEAYAAGVNAWIGEVNAGARGRGAPEFFLFSPRDRGLGPGGFASRS